MERQGRSHKPNNATQTALTNGDQEEKIRILAYQLFCESGYQHGHDQDHWLAAERRVLRISEKN